MKMLAVIPARGGSKGVRNKNIKLLGNKPLIAYTIESAIETGIFDKIIVSTDSDEIAETAEAYGAEIPYKRPDYLSGDDVSSDAAILHAIQFFEKEGNRFEAICKLQPTSPLRKAAHLKEAYDIFIKESLDYLVSVCECEHSPLWAGTLPEDKRMDNFLSEKVTTKCRQQLEKFYRLNGAIYMARTEAFVQSGGFFGNHSKAYLMLQKDSVDIDSELDFQWAEFLIEREGVEK